MATRVGISSYQEFLTVARASKEPLSFISPGTGSHGFLVGEYLARQEGYKLVVCRDLFIHHFGTRTFAHGAPVAQDGRPG